MFTVHAKRKHERERTVEASSPLTKESSFTAVTHLSQQVSKRKYSQSRPALWSVSGDWWGDWTVATAHSAAASQGIVFSVVEVVPPSQQFTLSLCQIKSLKQKATQVTLFNRTVPPTSTDLYSRWRNNTTYIYLNSFYLRGVMSCHHLASTTLFGLY